MAKKYLDHDIPEGRRSLIECHENLMDIAKYCEQNYSSTNDKYKALEITQQFTTQSLASVAYQVHTLASSMLNLLSEQDDELTRLGSAIDNISERVDIHCEKVARREVGALTARKPILKVPTVIDPPNPERAVKYIRKQINYNDLDDIGHGIKSGGAMRSSANASIVSRNTSSLSRSESQIDSRSQYNTIGRKIVVPTVPKSNVPQSHHETRERKNSTTSNNSYDSTKFSVNNGSSNRSSTIDINTPYLDSQVVLTRSYNDIDDCQLYNLPPPPQDINVDQISASSNSLNNEGFPSTLPPQASEVELNTVDEFNYPSHQDIKRPPSDANWIPRNYIERVKAIYDYQAAKHDELTFDEDTIIYVVAKNADGWWEGVLNGQAGLFPGNYVEVLPR